MAESTQTLAAVAAVALFCTLLSVAMFDTPAKTTAYVVEVRRRALTLVAFRQVQVIFCTGTASSLFLCPSEHGLCTSRQWARRSCSYALPASPALPVLPSIALVP